MLKHLKQLAHDSLIYGMAGIIARFMGVILLPIVTRVFSPSDYGRIGLVVTTMSLLSILVTLGLDNSAARWFWDSEDPRDRRITVSSWTWCQLCASVIVSIAIAFFARPIASLLTGSVTMAPSLRLAAVSLPLSGLFGVLTKWLRYQRRPWPTMIYSTIYFLICISCTFVCVVILRMGIPGYFIGQLCGNACGAMISALVLGNWLHPRFVRWFRLRPMLAYSLPLIPGGLAAWALALADRYFLRYYSSTSEVGLYQVGSSIAACVALGVSAFTQAWGPFAFSIQEKPNARRVYATILMMYLWIGSVACAAVTLFSPELLGIVASHAYSQAASVVGLLSLSYLSEGLYYIAALGPSLVRRTKPVAWSVLLAALLNIVLNFALIPRYGKEGAAVATIVAYAARAAFLFGYSQRLYRIPYRFAAAIAISLFTCAVVTVAPLWHPDSAMIKMVVKVGLLACFFPLALMLRLSTVAQMKSMISRAAPAS